jgi:WD repeat-containing protein 17
MLSTPSDESNIFYA